MADLKSTASTPSAGSPRSSGGMSLGLWLLPLIWIALLVIGILAAVSLWRWIPVAVGAVIVLAALAWVLVSTLSPAVPNRTCPECGEKGLVKMRRGAPGVHCLSCGFRDDSMHVAYLDEW